MATRNVYVRPRDTEVWAAAQKLGEDTGRGLSAIVAEALRQYLHSGPTGPVRQETCCCGSFISVFENEDGVLKQVGDLWREHHRGHGWIDVRSI